MAKKTTSNGLVKVVCTCDRLPLENGEILYRDMKAEMTAADAANYESAGRVTRV